MYRCNINDEDCPNLMGAVCHKPSDEKCSHSIWVDESPEGFIQLPVGTGIGIIAGGGRSVILEAQSIGRSRRCKDPILRSPSIHGGIWEVFSDELEGCGLSRDEYQQANLIYFLNPKENEPVFILKNRYGPSRYMGEGYLETVASQVKKWIITGFLGMSINTVPRDLWRERPECWQQ